MTWPAAAIEDEVEDEVEDKVEKKKNCRDWKVQNEIVGYVKLYIHINIFVTNLI